uniref:Tafazzin family protein n=1 Tax=Lepeophtheirus salmonis TaxID=72036 RepID=A0A0K2US33_LEPSM
MPSVSDIPEELYDTQSIFSQKDDPSWCLKSRLIISAVGIASKLWMTCFTRTNIHHRKILTKALEERPNGTPLITVANHHSCMDEPLLWGILDIKHVTNQSLMRWALAAHDICFTNKLHSSFFAYGKSIPVIRGNGVYQKGMDFCVDQLKKGSWVHLYPEGKVNMNPTTDLRLKWGLGRLISEVGFLEPIIIPIYHLGMDKVLPSFKPYIPRPWQSVTIVVGTPIQTKELLYRIRSSNLSDEEARKILTDRVQEEMRKLRLQAHIYHAKNTYKH